MFKLMDSFTLKGFAYRDLYVYDKESTLLDVGFSTII